MKKENETRDNGREPNGEEKVLRRDILRRLKDGEVLDKNTIVEELVDGLRRFNEGTECQPEDKQIQSTRESAGRIFDEIIEQDRHLKEVQKKLNEDEIDLKVIERANEIGEKEINLVASLKEQLNVREAEIEKIEEFSREVYKDNLNRLQSLRTRLSEVFKRANEAVKKAAAVKKDVVPPTQASVEPTPAVTPTTPEKEKIKNIDLPSALLAEVLEGREQELRRFMELMYKRAIKGEHGERVRIYLSDALQELFAKEPNEKIMGELKKHGIENWQEFCALLKGPVGDQVNRVMNKMVQEQIQRDVAKNTKWYENIWAIKGQMATRILTNITLVGGGVALASFAATGLGAGVLLGGGVAAAVGGGAGGFIRGLLQKHVFGTKKMEEKKKEKLQALAKRKQEELTERLLKNNFSETSDSEKTKKSEKTNKEVAAILAQVLREVSVAEKSGESPAPANLEANAKRQYLDALRAMNFENVEPDEIEKQKTELMEVLSALQAKGEQKQAEALKHSDPVVVRILDGVMRGYTGTHEKAGVVSASAIGAAVGVAFAASNEWARGVMGGIGGGLAGYKMAEKRWTGKEEEKALKEIYAELGSARVNLEFLEKETVPDLQKNFLEKLNFYVRKFRAAMRGGGDEAYALALKNNPMLRTQVENLIYESDKAAAVVEAEQRRKISALLDVLEKEGEAVAKEAEKKSKIKNWFKKTAGRVAGFSIGAAVGAGAAIILGEGIKEWRHILFGYHAPGMEPPHFGDKHVHHVEQIVHKPEPIEPTPTPKVRPAVEPVAVKPTVVVAAVATAEVAPPPHHTGDFDFAHPENDNTIKNFAEGRSVTTDEFDYLKSLAEKFPELNKSETFDKILKSAEYHSGKQSAFPDVYKGTINTPIEAAADSRFSTFDAILRAGGTKRAVEFLKLQDFNEHDLRGNLKLTGSLEGANLDNKLEELVKAYLVKANQGGDNKSGKHIFDAFRHDQNRVIAQYEDAKGVVRIKGIGRLNPRVLGEHNGKLLVGQAKAYGGVKWEAPIGKPLEGDIQPREFQFGKEKAYLGGAGKEFLPNEKGEMWTESSAHELKEVDVNEQTANLIKARAGHSAYFQETIKQPDGHVIEYHYDSGSKEVIAYDITADLATQAGAGSVAAGPAVEHALSSHAPRPVPISELWSSSKGVGGGGGGGAGGAGGSGASGGGVVEQAKGGGGVVQEQVTKKVGAGGAAVESHKTQGGVAELEKSRQQSAMAEASVKKFGDSQTDIAAEASIIKQEYVQTLSGVRSELEDKLSGLIMDDSRTQAQGNEIISLLDREIINASAGSSVDSSLLEIVKHNFGSSRVDIYDKVMGGLSDKLSLEQEFLFKGVPETVIKFKGLLVSAATDAPTHLLKYHSNDGWHARYDPDYLYSLSGKTLKVFDARTGLPVEGGGNVSRVK